MRNLRTVVLIAVFVAAVFATGSSPSGAQDGDSIDPDPNNPEHPVDDPTPVLTAEESLRDMAEFIAKEEDRDADEVHRQLLYQETVTGYLQELDESGQLDRRFAGASFSGESGQEAVWYFKGEVPKAHLDDLEKRGIDGLTLQGGQRRSLDELIEIQDRLHLAVAARGYENVFSSFDLGSQLVTIEVADGPPNAVKGSERSEAVATEASKGLSAEIGLDEFRIVDAPSGSKITDDHGYGGSWMRLSNGTDWCTSAFVVRRNTNNTEGVLTASHCEGLTLIADAGSGASFGAPWANEHIGNWGDVEWHTTTHDDFPQFYVSSSSRATVKSRISNNAISEDVYVCRYGRNTQRDCGDISAINVTHTTAAGTAQHLVEFEVCTGDGGDSGGPVYKGSAAWGVYKGHVGTTACIFSKIQNAELAFDVHVQFG